MASYTTLKYGSSGSDVKKMQEALISAGYDLGSTGADGIYGSKTQSAVKKYQQDKGLGVNGIAGSQTLGSLYGAGTGAAAAPTSLTGVSEPIKSAAEMLAQYEQNKPGEYQSPYAEQLAQYAQNKPGEYQSPWTEQIQTLYDQIVNREPFSYDFTSDPMYQHYADQYQQRGQQAMRDTMGQAAALTGGYGSSYGQMVGQQTYDNYLQGMNDVIPELRNAAYQLYQNEAAGDAEALSMLMNMEATDYNRYRDAVGDYYSDLGLLLDRDADAYNRYRDAVSDYYTDLDYYYGKAADEAALAAAAASGGGSGSSGKKSSTSSGYITDTIPKQITQQLKLYKGNNSALNDYLTGLVNAGLLSMTDATKLYNQNKTSSQVIYTAAEANQKKVTGQNK